MNIDLVSDRFKELNKEEACYLVANVQSRASGARVQLEPAFQRSEYVYYKARHREDMELNRARRTLRGADIRDVSYCCKPQPYETRSQSVLPDPDLTTV